jgi:hypothetical protein
MNLKTCSLSLLTLFIAGTALAQDEIYKRNGSVIEGKVIEVGAKTISYKKANNPDGPSYVIDKAQVAKIEYENGSKETFKDGRRPGPPMPPGFDRNDDEEDDSPVSNRKYGNNIIALSPMQLTDEGAGIGLSYERVLDKAKNYVSFYMPTAIAFKRFNDFNNNGDYSTLYLMPGIKFYPTGGKGVVRYGVGANIVFATGRDEYQVWQNGGIVSQWITEDFYKLGMIVNNSLNINPTEHLHLGLEFGLGFTYLDDRNSQFDDDSPLVQFGFKIGYRF